MKAIGISEYGSAQQLKFYEDVAEPTLKTHEVMVMNKCFSVNPIDIKVRSGKGPGGSLATPILKPPRILGWDGSGIVIQCGKDVTKFKEGDEVYYMNRFHGQGSYAEYTAVDERMIAHKPKTFSHVESAALPLTALTAWESLVEVMGIFQKNTEGKSLLIVGGSGGVGSIAIQLGKIFGDLKVYATASKTESRFWCLNMGADGVLDSHIPLKEQLEEHQIKGFDYILNATDFSNFNELADVLLPFGHMCGIVGSPHLHQLDVLPLVAKRASLSFEMVFTRSQHEHNLEKQGKILEDLASLVDSGKIIGTCHRTMSWKSIREAHQSLEERTNHMGKIVLRVEED
jgi:NADPH:quinone reductase